MSDIATKVGELIEEKFILHSELNGLESLEQLRKIYYDLTFKDMQFLPNLFREAYNQNNGVIDAIYPILTEYNKINDGYHIKIWLKNKSGVDLANQIIDKLSFSKPKKLYTSLL